MELGYFVLQLFVDVLRPADEPHRAHPGPVRPESLHGGLHDLRVAGEAEVVVGTEVQRLARPAHHLDGDVLHGGDHPLRLPGPSLADSYHGSSGRQLLPA